MIATPFRLASATLLMLASLGATAQSKDIVVDGQGEVPYVVDQRNVVARSGFDLCWRTGYWTPGAAAETHQRIDQPLAAGHGGFLLIALMALAWIERKPV